MASSNLIQQSHTYCSLYWDILMIIAKLLNLKTILMSKVNINLDDCISMSPIGLHVD